MKALILGLLGLSVLSIATMSPAMAVRTAIEASGNVQMNGALKSYQDNVLQSVTKECLAQKAAKDTVVTLTVDPHGNIMKIILSHSGLSSDAIVQLITALKALKLGDAGERQSDTLRITMDFDLAEVLAGAKSTGTSISIKGGSITGDGTATGGIRIGGGGSISAGGDIAVSPPGMPSFNPPPRRSSVTPDALNKLAELEKSPDSNLRELCNARLSLVPQYWRDEDLAKARDLLGQALKYLEGPAGPLSRDTTRNFQRIVPLLLASQTPDDIDLVGRIYAAIEQKGPEGCTDSDLVRLGRLNLPNISEKNRDAIASLFSRLLQLREVREGTGSPKLLPILTVIAKEDESQHKYDAALTIQQRIAHIQKQNGGSSDAEAMNLLTTARLSVLTGKFAEALSDEKNAIVIASQAQSSAAQKSKLAPGLAALSSAYIDRGDMLKDADRVVREAVDMAGSNHSTPAYRDAEFNACTATLIERYRQLGQSQKAIELLEYLLEKPNIAPEATTNTWRYDLARLYLDLSHGVGGKSPHGSKAVTAMMRQSKLYFDTAQNISKTDNAGSRPITERFVQERIDALRRYKMIQDADELQAQQAPGQQNTTPPVRE